MKILQGLLKAPPWLQETPSPQKVGEYLGEFQGSPVLPRGKELFPKQSNKPLLYTEPGGTLSCHRIMLDFYITRLDVQYFNWEVCKRKLRARLFYLPLSH